MNREELLTRLAIWLALLAYAGAAGLMLAARKQPHLLSNARWVWTVGCAFFLVHVACAFQFYHHWSHADAYRETARQTGEMSGVNWGGGIYFNYVFAAAWLADVVWWWSSPGSHRQRASSITAALHGFFVFMVFNGTVIFGHGPVRVLGALICLGLAVLWWRRR